MRFCRGDFQPGSLTYFVGFTGTFLALLLIPLSIGMAILRARLWDIDIIIRRTLIYSTLTGALALVYVGSVVLLQAVLRPLLGQQSPPLVTVASTLAIAALFTPLRRRIQAIIDQHFYRRRYNAARTLAAFSIKMRDQVDLSTLTDDLLTVVKETMQPAHLSLWLGAGRQPARRGFGESAMGRRQRMCRGNTVEGLLPRGSGAI